MNRRMAIAGFAVILMALFTAAWAGSRMAPSDQSHRGTFIERGGILPYPDGWKTSLEEANAKVPFPLLVPDHPAANSRNVTAVYVRPGGETVAMQFPAPEKADVRQPYLEVFLLPWAGGNPARHFAESIEKDPVTGRSLHTVDGLTAEGTLPRSPDDVDEANPAFLRFVYRGVEVQISGGDSLPLLEEIAKTIIA